MTLLASCHKNKAMEVGEKRLSVTLSLIAELGM